LDCAARVALAAVAILRKRRSGDDERGDEDKGAQRHTERLSNTVASDMRGIFTEKSHAARESRPDVRDGGRLSRTAQRVSALLRCVILAG
jgi:hypothetical protein